MTPQQLQQFLESLANDLSPAGQQVFQYAVQNQIITAVIGIVVGMVLIVVGLLGLIRIVNHTRTLDFDWNEDEGFLSAAGITVSVIIIVVGAVLVATLIPQLLDPQWYALKDIMNQIPGNKGS